jgi:hypothetical protein
MRMKGEEKKKQERFIKIRRRLKSSEVLKPSFTISRDIRKKL